MAETHGIIAVEVRRSATGLFTATSEALAGVYIAHREIAAIIADMPKIIEHWFKIHRKQDIVVFTGPLVRSDDTTSIQVIPVPAEIAAQSATR